MSGKLHTPFLGVSLHSSIDERRGIKSAVFGRRNNLRRAIRKCSCSKQNPWVSRAVWFSHFCQKNVELLKKNIGSRSGFVVKSVKEPLNRSKALVKSLTPVWHEGLLLFRCSVFVAVVSGVCLLVWYGQTRAKGFVESKLLPSVCSTLSEYFERELNFGKVRRISPLSITLESCSFGPYAKEFSCAEVPTIKLRLLPFASLKRGKIVVDAVMSHPSLLVVQKKDYTWLGIPYSEGSLQRHLSSEEGIDYRTRTRRIAREEAAARWAKQRDDAAAEAARGGYIVSEKGISQSEDDSFREDSSHLAKQMSSESFLRMEEKIHWRDHHCMDTGADYDMKHADLEKSFGVKMSGSGMNFWSKVIQGTSKTKLKRKANGNDVSEDHVVAKRRLLDRSALAAVSYFQGLSRGITNELSTSPGDHDIMDSDILLRNYKGNVNEKTSKTSYEGNSEAGSGNRKHIEPLGIKQFTIIGDDSKSLKTVPHDSSPITDGTKHSSENPSAELKDMNIDTDVANQLMDIDDASDTERLSPAFYSPTLFKIQPWFSMNINRDFRYISGNVKEQLFYLVAGPFQKFKSSILPKLEDFVAELVDGVEISQNEGISKMLPVTLDSVYFKDGSLTLLAYGDTEPR